MKSKTGNPKSKIVPATAGSPIVVLKPELRFDFGPRDPLLAVKELIQTRHVGAANAITIEGIAQELWYNEWWFSRLDGKNRASYPHRDEVQRLVKDLVSKLRHKDKRFGALRGSKGGASGYFFISTDQEFVASLTPYFNQALTMLITIHDLTGIDLFIHELRDKLAELKNLKLVSADGADYADSGTIRANPERESAKPA